MSFQWVREKFLFLHQKRMLIALRRGIEKNCSKTVLQCVRCEADVNSIIPGMRLTPLELALQKRNVFMLQLLLDTGADTERRNTQRETILTTAIRYGYMECVKLLVEHRANVNACSVNGMSCLLFALQQKRYSIVAYLLEQASCEVDVCGRNGNCLLQLLVLANEASLISNIKNRGVNLNTRCPDGTVAVFFATKHCKNKALKALLDSGADPNIGTANKDFALHEAIRRNNAKAVKNLMLHGANTLIVDKSGLTPIHVAVEKKCLHIMRLLLDRGAGIEHRCIHGSTPLLAACSAGYMEAVELLVRHGADLSAHDCNGMTCLQIAQEKEHHSIVACLLKNESCEVDLSGRDGLNSLQSLILMDDVAAISRLVSRGVNLDARCSDGTAAVFLAAKHCKNKALKALLEAGADPNIDTKDGDFALHEAVSQRSIASVKVLLQHGADKDRLDKRGMTPIEVAEELVPPPQEIIHRLNTKYKANKESEGLPSIDNSVKDHVDHPARYNRKLFDAEMEQSLCCPITFEIMKDPVIASDGHTYECKAIKEWIREKKESPVTRQPITSATLIPNLTVKHLIDQFAKLNRNT